MTVRGSLLRGEMSVRGARVVGAAIQAWRTGSPVWELPLLNHLTGRLAGTGRGTIKVHGTTFGFDTFVSDFHQQGEGSRDLYGADLGVAVHLPEPPAVKYALFQLKVLAEREKRVVLSKDQLSAALDPEVEDRTFVVAVGRKEGEPRVGAVRALHEGFDRTSPKGYFDTSRWEPLEEWVHGWLTCRVGRKSHEIKPGDYPPGSLERRVWLREFFGGVEGAPQQYRKELEYSTQRPIPARAFVRIYVNPERREDDRG